MTLEETLQLEVEKKLKELSLSWDDIESVAVQELTTEDERTPQFCDMPARLLTPQDAKAFFSTIGGVDWHSCYTAFTRVNFLAWTSDFILFPTAYETQDYGIDHIPRNPVPHIHPYWNL